MNACSRCGTDAGSGVPRPNSCGSCFPVTCSDCGESDDRYCSCWISLDGMALADIKAVFAGSDLSINLPAGDVEGAK